MNESRDPRAPASRLRQYFGQTFGGLPVTAASAHQMRFTRWLYLRLLATSALCAFLSMYWQLPGLFSSRGIAPAADFMDMVAGYADAQHWGALRRFLEVPTLAWISASDVALRVMAGAGVVASLLLLLDIAPGLMVAISWLLYLSLVKVGGVFFHFQWDTLLLETLFVSLFVAPWRLFSRRVELEPAGAGVWLLRLLLFKLMFLSGVVKLMAHDDTWTSLRALDVHFFTQPLPTWTAYYAHFAPHWLHAGALLVTLVIELFLPFLVFGSRRMRRIFGLGSMVLMLMIGLSGNYGFFNLLTFSLAVMCFDDGWLGRLVPAVIRDAGNGETASEVPARSLSKARGLWAAAGIILLLSALSTLSRLDRDATWGRSATGLVAPFLSINSYGLFQDMTMSRPEIIIEGSVDGETWRPYEFEYKPGELDRRPRFTGPFMPRLDWQMWFAALGQCQSTPWFHALLRRLFEGSQEVLELLRQAPFDAEEPPRYLRTTVYDYTFAPPSSPLWWQRAAPRPYCPVFARTRTAP